MIYFCNFVILIVLFVFTFSRDGIFNILRNTVPDIIQDRYSISENISVEQPTTGIPFLSSPDFSTQLCMIPNTTNVHYCAETYGFLYNSLILKKSLLVSSSKIRVIGEVVSILLSNMNNEELDNSGSADSSDRMWFSRYDQLYTERQKQFAEESNPYIDLLPDLEYVFVN